MPKPKARQQQQDDGGPQSTDRKGENFEPTQDEQDAVRGWLDRVKRAEESPKRKTWAERLETYRGYVNGSKKGVADQSNQELVRVNMIFATMSAMMPRLYAKNPDISITPSAGCPKDQLATIKKFCATADTVMQQMFVKEAKLKRRAKANVRSTMTTSYGVLKMIFQEDLQADPLTLRRIQDAQDNLARVEALAKALKKGDDVAELATQRDTLRANLTGLMSGNEVRVFKGLVIDRVSSEDFLVLDDTIREFDEYVDAAALGHRVWMTVSKYREQFGADPHGATRYNQPVDKSEGAGIDNQKPEDMFVCVVEIWDKDAQVVRTVAKGMNRWCRMPYAPKHTPQRWYSFYVLGFNLLEGQWRPLSDVELLMGLQDEYSEVRTNYADVRSDAVPVRVFRKAGGLTEDDIKQLSIARRNRAFIGIEGNPTVRIADDIMQLEGPRIDPQAYDVSQIRNDMDVMVGLSDAGRSNLIQPKTATEAEIMQQSLGLRVDERRDTNEDLIGDMAEAALEIVLRALTEDEVRQIAGSEAVWPRLSVAQIFQLVQVQVRAGSSGKPNAAKDREQWTQLLPVISNAMQQVGDLRAAGNFDAAESVLGLLRETLRRFEERLDVDSLVPPVDRGEDGQPVAVSQQLMQARQSAEQLTAQVEELQAALAKAQEGEASKVAAEQARAAAEAAKISKTQEDADLAKAQLESRERIALSEHAKKAEVAKHEADRRAELEHEKLAAEEQRMAAERAHEENLKRIQVGATEEERSEKVRGQHEAELARQQMAAVQEMLDRMLQTGAKLEDEIRQLAVAAKAPRPPRRIELGRDGLPARLVDDVPEVTH